MEPVRNSAHIWAGAMFVGAAAIHAFMGGPEINAPIQSSALDPVVRSVAAVVWHVITALALVLAGALFWVARHPNPTVLWIIHGINASFVAIFLWVGVAQLGSVWPMPQWTIFAAISAVMFWGMRAQPS